MMKRSGVLAALVLVCLAGTAAAQEGAGASALQLRASEIRALYPPAARDKGLEGEAVVTCQTDGGAIWACALTSETPAGEGFGAAGLAVVKRYEADAPPTTDPNRIRPRVVTVPFRQFPEQVFRVGGLAYELPKSLRTPPLDALYEAWPSAARFSGVEGMVSLWCTVTLAGRLEACTVGKESVAGQGFGEAALKLAPLYRFTPARRNGAPVAMSIPVLVAFICDLRCQRFEDVEAAPASVSVWASVPTPAQVQAAWPSAARARGQDGQARLDCRTTHRGGLEDCRVVGEAPADQGFGAAALSLAGLFRVAEHPPERLPERLSFSVAFDPRPGLANQVWEDFGASVARARARISAGPRPNGPLAVNGSSRLRCQVGQGGLLEACIVLESTPPDPEVARQVFENLDLVRAPAWTKAGRSTIGSPVEVTVQGGALANPRLAPDPPVAPPIVAAGVLDYRPQVLVSSPLDMSRYFPDRAQRMEVNGRVLLTCAGVKDGHPDGCEVTAEYPLDYGFGDAALRMSRVFRYSPRSIDGVRTDEALTIPLAFSIPR